ncbi:MAG: DNA cytosine methyltransferase [Pseudomonadota bacterium]
MTAYYNEIDPFAANWLRELIKAGHIAPGDVDERSIEDVKPIELKKYTQCHFFAGIGGWSLALRLAGWPDDKSAWTGSCPCQPFSAAGQNKGFDDERHLWPSWYWLIKQCRPAILFGEQVASKATGPWFDLVQADVEELGYAFGLVPFPAAGIGAPHIRDRAYWVADRDHKRLEGRERVQKCSGERATGQGGVVGGLANPDRWEQQGQPIVQGAQRDGENTGRQEGSGEPQPRGNTSRPSPTKGVWGYADWLGCRDGKFRPVEPGTFPLANGIPNRVGSLRGYGNAIVPQQAAEFVRAVDNYG